MEPTREELNAFRKRLMDATYPGPKSNWVNRIADLCEQAGFSRDDMSKVCWSDDVAKALFNLHTHGKIRFGGAVYDQLLVLIGELESEHSAQEQRTNRNGGTIYAD